MVVVLAVEPLPLVVVAGMALCVIPPSVAPAAWLMLPLVMSIGCVCVIPPLLAPAAVAVDPWLLPREVVAVSLCVADPLVAGPCSTPLPPAGFGTALEGVTGLGAG